MLQRSLLVPTVLSAFASATAQGGFVSSNGFSLPLGIICDLPSEDGRVGELQVKLTSEGYVVRHVVAPEAPGAAYTITPWTAPMGCRATTHADELAIENSCSSLPMAAAAISRLEVAPHRDRVLILVESPLIDGGRTWLALPASQCHVALDEDILPQQ